MAIKLKTSTPTKTKAAAKKVVGKAQTGIEQATALVPDAFAIKKKMAVLEAQMKNLNDELKPIETTIRDLCEPELESTQEINLINEDKILNISGKLQTRSIKDIDTVVIALEEFEEGLALKLAKFGIGDLDKYFSPEEMAGLTEIKEGNRRLKYK